MFSEGSLDGVVDTLEQRSARILDPRNSRRESASFFLALNQFLMAAMCNET